MSLLGCHIVRDRVVHNLHMFFGGKIEQMFQDKNTQKETKNIENHTHGHCPAFQNYSAGTAHCRADPDPILRLACHAADGTC